MKTNYVLCRTINSYYSCRVMNRFKTYLKLGLLSLVLSSPVLAQGKSAVKSGAKDTKALAQSFFDESAKLIKSGKELEELRAATSMSAQRDCREQSLDLRREAKALKKKADALADSYEQARELPDFIAICVSCSKEAMTKCEYAERFLEQARSKDSN